MMRGMTILWTMLALMVGISLFLLKYEVQSLEERLAALDGEIRRNQESLHVLKAEWSYLNDPARLRELNERHLELKPYLPEQVIAIADLPMAAPDTPDAPEDEPASRRTLVEAQPPSAPPTKRKAPARLVEANTQATAPKSAKRVAETVAPAATKPAPGRPPGATVIARSAQAAPAPVRTVPLPPPTPVRTLPQPVASPTPDVLVIRSPALLQAEGMR